MSNSRTQLKARFSTGQRIGESDFHALIESLAHLNEDIVSGEIATGESVETLGTKIDDLKAFAEAHKADYDSYKGNQPTLEQVEARDNQVLDTVSTDITALGNLVNSTKAGLEIDDSNLRSSIDTNSNDITDLKGDISQIIADINALASTASVESVRDSLLALLAGKADTSHTHSEYVQTSEISNYATKSDLDELPQQGHIHDASDIQGLSEIYATPNDVQELINLNKHQIDFSILYDEFYTKADVDEKIRISFGLLEDKIVAIVNAKIDQLQESINNLTPPNPYTLYDVDPVEAEALSGVEASDVYITATSPIDGLVLTGDFTGAVIQEVSISSSANYNYEIFKGTTNPDQLLAFNQVEDQWEWIEADHTGQKLIAVYETTDYSVVPEFWTLNPIGDYEGDPVESFEVDVVQTSDSDLVNIFNEARFISTGYVSQGLNYVRRVP
jgi:hypothetical protein